MTSDPDGLWSGSRQAPTEGLDENREVDGTEEALDGEFVPEAVGLGIDADDRIARDDDDDRIGLEDEEPQV